MVFYRVLSNINAGDQLGDQVSTAAPGGDRIDID